MLTVNLLFVNRLDEDLQATSGPAIILAFILLCIILIHFLWNHKRRLQYTSTILGRAEPSSVEFEINTQKMLTICGVMNRNDLQ